MDENESQAAESAAETPNEIETLKNEMNQKFSKMEDINAQLQALNASLQSQVAPKQTTKNLKDLVYDNPDEFVSEIKQQIRREVQADVDQRISTTSAAQAKVSEISAQYPDFANSNSAAYKLAQQLYADVPASLKGTPEGAEMAMLRAASKLGLSSNQTRRTKASTEDFTISGQNSGSRKAQARTEEDTVSPETKFWAAKFAEVTGRDPNDQKLLDGVKQASKRKSWNRYE